MPGGLARRPPRRSDKDEQVTGALYLEAMIGHWIRLVAIGIEIFGALIIVAGIVWSTSRSLRQQMEERHYDRFKS